MMSCAGGRVHHATAAVHEVQPGAAPKSRGGVEERRSGVRPRARGTAVGHAKILPADIHGGVRSNSDGDRDCHGGSIGVVADEGVTRPGSHR